MSATWDRRSDDVGNIAFLEHVNLVLPDLDLATQFFVNAEQTQRNYVPGADPFFPS